MSQVKRIDIKEFREFGYLQELNRSFLHPLGLALEVVIEEDGGEHLGGVWDYRDDPEGIRYGDGMLDAAKARRVEQSRSQRWKARALRCGWFVQPVDAEPTTQPEGSPDE